MLRCYLKSLLLTGKSLLQLRAHFRAPWHSQLLPACAPILSAFELVEMRPPRSLACLSARAWSCRRAARRISGSSAEISLGELNQKL